MKFPGWKACLKHTEYKFWFVYYDGETEAQREEVKAERQIHLDTLVSPRLGWCVAT